MKNYDRKIIFTLLATLFTMVGCSGQKFSSIDLADLKPDQIKQVVPLEKVRPSCEAVEIDYQFEAQVISFDVVSKNDTHFGFSLIPGLEWFKSFDSKFRLKKSVLSVSTGMAEFLRPTEPFGQAFDSSEQKESFWGTDIDLNKIVFGHSSFSATPFYKVMLDALRKSFTKTASEVRDIESPWNTIVVSKTNETDILIPAGKNAGLQVGDEFEIYNVEHQWVEEPCKSNYRMAKLTTDEPILIAKINDSKDLTPNASRLIITKRILDNKIELGAFVYTHQFKPARKLKRSIAIKEIKPFKINWQPEGANQNKELDITVFLNAAINSLANEMGFYIRPKNQ
ncbi:MAG: hypothetical protein JNL11_02460 [Bdellovibrionaceae bacterium]|nr:hypothetical protein [Pseudobdellovibrionaceae bacterium]